MRSICGIIIHIKRSFFVPLIDGIYGNYITGILIISYYGRISTKMEETVMLEKKS